MKDVASLARGLVPSTESKPATASASRSAGSLSPNLTERFSKGSGPLSERVIGQLWERMGAIYGHKWTSQHGEEDDGTWAKGLMGIAPQQIAHGISGCALSGDAWPPSLPQFRAMCEQQGEPFDPSDGAQVAARMPRARALPEPAESRARRKRVGRFHLKQIYERLGWERKTAAKEEG